MTAPSLEAWQDKLGPAVVWAAGFVSESFGKRLLNLINPMHERLSKSGKRIVFCFMIIQKQKHRT